MSRFYHSQCQEARLQKAPYFNAGRRPSRGRRYVMWGLARKAFVYKRYERIDVSSFATSPTFPVIHLMILLNSSISFGQQLISSDIKCVTYIGEKSPLIKVTQPIRLECHSVPMR